MTEKDFGVLADLLYPNSKDITYYFNKYKPRKTVGEVTRLGPSPTGYLHIGQVYQALVHKFLARETGGVFFLRLEDTDNKREVDQAGEIAYEGLVRYDLTPDEGYAGTLPEIGDYGPYKQSNRLEIYHDFAHELVRRGRAFPCFCSAKKDKAEIVKSRAEELKENSDLSVKDPCRDLSLEEIKQKLSEGKEFALRLRSNGDGEKTFKFTDLILGEREIRANEKDDVLIKSNGIPVYAFAHIVDDTLMGTTIIVRGQDWFQSLPVHIELSEAFGFKPFRYAHTPNICTIGENGNKRKISKRKDVFADVRFYLKTGYPVEAVNEYVLTLLNSNFEIWRAQNPEKSYKEFHLDLKKIGVSNPLFDFVKLNDISKTIISKFSEQEVYDNALKWAQEWDKNSEAILIHNKEVFLKVFAINRGGDRPRKDITFYSEIISLYDYVLENFEAKFEFNLGGTKKENLLEFLLEYKDCYSEASDNSTWFNNLKEIALKHNFADNKIYKQNPENYAGNISDASKYVRLAITGKENSPELFSIMNIIGKEKVKQRLTKIISYIEKL